MEEAPENGKESSHSAHGSGMNDSMKELVSLPLLFPHRNGGWHDKIIY
jgi:hypothetical protein